MLVYQPNHLKEYVVKYNKDQSYVLALKIVKFAYHFVIRRIAVFDSLRRLVFHTITTKVRVLFSCTLLWYQINELNKQQITY